MASDTQTTKWTPGPWGWEYDDFRQAIMVDVPSLREVHGSSVSCRCYVAEVIRESEAPLIAAAPELYEALAEAIQREKARAGQCEELLKANEVPLCEVERTMVEAEIAMCEHHVEQWSSTIAKARGEQTPAHD